MGKPRIGLSPPTPSASDADRIVELCPPPDAGFSGTVLIEATQAALIQALKERGYTEVTHARG